MKIVVIGGGNSPERDVSLRSSKAVSDALKEAGYEVDYRDLNIGMSCLDGIDKDTIVFPILHGAEGEDGVIQKEMEDRGLPYLGSNSSVSELCFDKELTRQKLTEAGIKMPEGIEVDKETYKTADLAKKPHVIKVSRGGSSIGTLLNPDPSKIDQNKVQEVFELGDKAMVEELIIGTEITVPVLDGVALPVIEIVPPADEEFDYENKYNGKTQEICPTKSLSPEEEKAAREIAENVNQILGCRHLSRVDIMIRENREMLVLEANTMPGMTDQSLFPLSAKVAGLPMPKLMEKFVELVRRDYNL